MSSFESIGYFKALGMTLTLQKEGIDVVIALVETHYRSETARLLVTGNARPAFLRIAIVRSTFMKHQALAQ